MRRTKIVATLGPATSSAARLHSILAAGVDVVRLNAAHADGDEIRRLARTAREQAERLDRVVGVLVDLPGPKMRTGDVDGGIVTVDAGTDFRLVPGDAVGDEHGVGTTVDTLASMVEPGDPIFLADGEIVLRVAAVDGGDVRAEVVRGGTLRSRKGLAVPGAEDDLEPFGPADAAALDAALDAKADFVGLSFVRRPDDVRRVLDRLPKRGPKPRLVPKIETQAALDHLEGVIDCSDALIVARGDLGIQVELGRVPLLQKEIVHAANLAGVPVITATHMLESMTRNPLPTRAEAGDVANAVLDGTDAVMLSEETAIGDFPREAVDTMAELAEVAESWQRDRVRPELDRGDRVAWAVAHAAVEAAEDLGVSAILCGTRSGATARKVAAFRPRVPIVALSDRPEVAASLRLVWGVVPLVARSAREASDDPAQVAGVAHKAGLVATGDLVAVVAGAPGPRAGATDTVRVVRA